MTTENTRELVSRIEQTPTGVKLDLTIYAYADGSFVIQGRHGAKGAWITTRDPMTMAERLVYLTRKLNERARRRRVRVAA